MNDCNIVYWLKYLSPIAPIVHPHDLINLRLLKSYDKILEKKKISTMHNFIFSQNPQYIILNKRDIYQYLFDTLCDKNIMKKF
jgi:hypothetical protein